MLQIIIKMFLFLIAFILSSYSNQSQDSILSLISGNWRWIQMSDDGGGLMANYDTLTVTDKITLSISKNALDSIYPMHYVYFKNGDTLCVGNYHLYVQNTYWFIDPSNLVAIPSVVCQDIFVPPTFFVIQNDSLYFRQNSECCIWGYVYKYIKIGTGNILQRMSIRNFNKSNSLSVYSNYDSINLIMNRSGFVSLFAPSGKCIFNKYFMKGSHNIKQHSSLRSGIYLIRFSTDGTREYCSILL